MVLYNVTVGIDKDMEMEWISWMKESHIPKVLATGMFTGHKIYKVISEDDETTVSYSIQYFSDSLDKVVHYLNELASPLVNEHLERYKDKHVAFRTLLDEVL